MQLDLDAADLREMEVPPIELPAGLIGVRAAIIPISAFETGIAGGLTMPDAPKEGSKSFI